jgi:hypothetical protein
MFSMVNRMVTPRLAGVTPPTPPHGPPKRHRTTKAVSLPLIFIRVGLDLDVAPDDIGIVFQVVRRLQDVFFLDILDTFDFHIHILRRRNGLLRTLVLDNIAPGAARTWLLDRLFRPAFRADRWRLGQVVKSRAASDANPLGAEFRLSHECIRPFVTG